MSRIAIIGAGLSGRLLALNLLRRATSDAPVVIRMLDRGDERHMGPAYSDEADYLLLNVPAGRMGAPAADPEHFVKWLRDRGHRQRHWDFAPRALFREYVLSLLRDAIEARAESAEFEYVRGEVADIYTEGGRATLHVEGGGSILADKVVLALGNFPPCHPAVVNRTALESERYVRNPWSPGVFDSIGRRDTVFLIGTGQTTADLVVALHHRSHEGRIIAISRRGLLPLAHRRFEPYPSFFEDLRKAGTILDISRTVRAHIHRAESLGVDMRSVIDSLRPHTQTIWAGLPEVEKRRFLRHLSRYWEIIRSRIPPESAAVIDPMRVSGQLEIVAGRIRNLVATDTTMEVHYVSRGGTAREVVEAALVVNCMGPESNCGRIDAPLVRNLTRRGLIRPGPAHLGIDALPNGAVLGHDGVASGVFYTLGSTMKGVLWEVVAVPEIRVQAEELARLLIDSAPPATCSGLP